MELFRISSENVGNYATLGFDVSGQVQRKVIPLLFDPEPQPGYGMSWENLRYASQYILAHGTGREDRVRKTYQISLI